MNINLYFMGILLGFSSLIAEEPIALVIKSRGNTTYRLSTENKFQKYARVNTPIYHGNGMKTKKKAFTKITYLDDRTSISVFPESEITINGVIENRMINKEIKILSGILRINVFNQKSNEFKLITSHSVLTCIECNFWIISDDKIGDRFYKISGDGLVSNLSIDETMELVSDSTVLSMQDIEMAISLTSVMDDKYLELLMLDADEVSEVPYEALIKQLDKLDDENPEKTINIVVIKLINAVNVERQIVLTYSQ